MEQKLTTACRVVPMMINNRELENLRQFRMPKLPPSPSNSFGLHRVMRWRPWNESKHKSSARAMRLMTRKVIVLEPVHDSIRSFKRIKKNVDNQIRQGDGSLTCIWIWLLQRRQLRWLR